VLALGKNAGALKAPERVTLVGDEWRMIRAGRHDIGTYLDLAGVMAVVSEHGWITHLEARDDGLYGRAKWSGEGLEMVRNRFFRFLSPYWVTRIHEGHLNPIELLSLGMTNTPNLPVKSLMNTAPGLNHPDALSLIEEELLASGPTTEVQNSEDAHETPELPPPPPLRRCHPPNRQWCEPSMPNSRARSRCSRNGSIRTAAR
jgi:hypothetical protein